MHDAVIMNNQANSSGYNRYMKTIRLLSLPRALDFPRCAQFPRVRGPGLPLHAAVSQRLWGRGPGDRSPEELLLSLSSRTGAEMRIYRPQNNNYEVSTVSRAHIRPGPESTPTLVPLSCIAKRRPETTSMK